MNIATKIKGDFYSCPKDRRGFSLQNPISFLKRKKYEATFPYGKGSFDNTFIAKFADGSEVCLHNPSQELYPGWIS